VYVFSQNKGTLFSPFPKKKGLSFFSLLLAKDFLVSPGLVILSKITH